MLCKNFQRYDYVCNSSFIICSEDRGSVTDNQILPYVFQQFRMIFDRYENLFLFILADISALIIPDDYGVNVRRHARIHSVHMRHPTDHRHRSVAFRQAGWETAYYNSMVINADIDHAKLCDILHQKPGKIPLAGRAWHGLDPCLALASHSRIAQKTGHQPVLQRKSFYIHQRSLLSIV